MADNVWRGHAVTRPDYTNERVQILLMTRTTYWEGRGMERELFILPNLVQPSPKQMFERRGPACCTQWHAPPVLPFNI